MPNETVTQHRNELAERGFVVARGLIDAAVVADLADRLRSSYQPLRDKLGVEGNVLTISRHLVENDGYNDALGALYRRPEVLDLLESMLGPDLAMIPFINLWIGDPDDASSVTTKPLHQEHWSGAGLEDLTVWIPLTGPDPTNTLCVVPGSHLWGIVPNRNRRPLFPPDVEAPVPEPLADVAPGDVVVFHSLLLHASGVQKSSLRFSSSAIIKPLFAETSHKNTSLGQHPIRIGPLTQIRRMLGNDQLTPFRTYGGATSNKPPSLPDADES